MCLRYGSPAKYANFVRAWLHYRRSSPIISTMPVFLKVEISRKCDVHCKYCPAKKQDVFYPLDLYKGLIDRLKKHLFLVSLHDIGEPLQNANVSEYIRYAHANRIGVALSSSLSLQKPDDFWKELVSSAPDRLVVAIDGTTQQVYEQYRTHGDLQLALSNLGKILDYRKRFGVKICIEWQMIDLPWNRCQQQAARKMANELGCDQFRLIKEVTVQRSKYQQEAVPRQRGCPLPYLILIVNAYDQVKPCYKFYNEHMFLGNLHQDGFEQVWNGDQIGMIRNKQAIRSRIICKTCRE